MTVWFWKVYDKRVVEACFLPVLVLSAAIAAAILLPAGSGRDLVGNIILVTTVILIIKFCGAVFGRR